MMSEEKQRILLLEQVSLELLLLIFVKYYVFNKVYFLVADFTHEGRGKQASQSKTGRSISTVATNVYLTLPPLGGSSTKD